MFLFSCVESASDIIMFVCVFQIQTKCDSCRTQGPNLWVCLHGRCLYVGCGESGVDHSAIHSEVSIMYRTCIDLGLIYFSNYVWVVRICRNLYLNWLENLLVWWLILIGSLQRDRHYLTLNLTTLRIWCYDCECEVFKDGNDPPLMWVSWWLPWATRPDVH